MYTTLKNMMKILNEIVIKIFLLKSNQLMEKNVRGVGNILKILRNPTFVKDVRKL